MNITNNIIVRDEVGKISEAIRLAEDPAGDAKINNKQTISYLHNKFSIE
jgi:hypothetical protein